MADIPYDVVSLILFMAHLPIDHYLELKRYIPIERQKVNICPELKRKLDIIFRRRGIMQKDARFLDSFIKHIGISKRINILLRQEDDQVKMFIRYEKVDAFAQTEYTISYTVSDIHTGHTKELRRF